MIPGPKVSPDTFTRSIALLQASFGVQYAPEKIILLFRLIDEEGWSEERFKMTFNWFIKNKPFPAWTIADWFSYGVKLYPYEWYLEQQSKAGIYIKVLKDMDIYDVEGVRLYRWKDGIELPLKKINQ